MSCSQNSAKDQKIITGRPLTAVEWQAVLDRDVALVGQFYYGVVTTKIFCRSTCPARRPKHGNAVYFDEPGEAMAMGFRPCKRCQPTETGGGGEAGAPHLPQIIALCRQLESAETLPSLDQMAAGAGLSAAQFHRLFKTYLGVTPRAYCEAVRQRRIKEGLATKAPITAVIYESGYSSSTRFYERAIQHLGMTASDVRKKGRGVELRFAIGETSLGAVLVALSTRGVAAIELGKDPEVLLQQFQSRFADAELVGDDPEFNGLIAQVIGYIERPGQAFPLPLDIRGTAFQRRVWEALMAIPQGETISYGAIATAIGKPHAYRAVAGACAANKLAVVIPCHRVIRLDGSLSGYRWGVETKRAILALEKSALEQEG